MAAPTRDEMGTWHEHRIFAWVAQADLDDLRTVQGYDTIGTPVQAAIMGRVSSLEAAADQAEASRNDARRFRIILAVAGATLVVAGLGLLRQLGIV